MVKLNRYFLIFIPLFLISVNSSAGLLQTLKYTVSTFGSSSIFRVSSAGTSSASVVGATAGTANGGAAVVRTVSSDFANLLNKPSTLTDFSRVVEPVSLAAMAGAALPFLRIASPLGVAVSFLPEVIKWLKDAGYTPAKDANGNPDFTQPLIVAPSYTNCSIDSPSWVNQAGLSSYDAAYSKITSIPSVTNIKLMSSSLTGSSPSWNYTFQVTGYTISPYSSTLATFSAYIGCSSSSSSSSSPSDSAVANKLSSTPPSSTTPQGILGNLINLASSDPLHFGDVFPTPDGTPSVLPAGSSSTSGVLNNPGTYINSDGSSTIINSNKTSVTSYKGNSTTVSHPDGSSTTSTPFTDVYYPGDDTFTVTDRITTSTTSPTGQTTTYSTPVTPSTGSTSTSNNLATEPTLQDLRNKSASFFDDVRNVTPPSPPTLGPSSIPRLNPLPPIFAPSSSQLTGYCPADKTIPIFGKQYVFSIQPMCSAAEIVSHFLVAFAYLIAIRVVFSSLQSST